MDMQAKTSPVREMFARIARRYDLANDCLSFGLHHSWRRKAVAQIRAEDCKLALDLCTGTGDLAFALLAALPRGAIVAGVDLVPEMLVLARKKRAKKCPAAPLFFLQADAMNLPFSSDSVDCVTIAFGIRNTPDPVSCLVEVKRVLKPSGKLIVLEFGQPRTPFFAWLFRVYSRLVIPRLGGLLSGDKSAYAYLRQTSRSFPAGSEFQKLLAESGLAHLESTPLVSGVAYIYRAVKPQSH